VGVAISLLFVPLAANGGTDSSASVIRSRGAITTIAMDGPRIGYDAFVPSRGCNKIFVADLATGRSQSVSRCASDVSTSRYVALAGPRTAWIDEAGGPDGYDRTLWVASPGRKPRQLASASCDGNLDAGDPCVGTWISSLVGSDGLLAVNRGATNARGIETRSALDLIGPTRLRRVASGTKASFAQGTDSGRVAVLRPNGTIAIYSAAGKLLLQVKPASVADQQIDGDSVALKGRYLLVLSRARRLEVYSTHSGTHLHSLRVRKGATNLAAVPGLVAYAEFPRGASACCSGYKVHVVRLATGKDAVLGTGTWFNVGRNVALGRAGLAYLKDRRTVVFVPLSRVWAAVS
jgi:hypothetical protein